MARVEHWDSVKWGALNEENLTRKLDEQGYFCTRYVYPPGTHFPDHTHGVHKKDAVLSGRFRIVLEGEEVVLEAGDCVDVPAGVMHNATVLGNQSVVSLDAVRR